MTHLTRGETDYHATLRIGKREYWLLACELRVPSAVMDRPCAYDRFGGAAGATVVVRGNQAALAALMGGTGQPS